MLSHAAPPHVPTHGRTASENPLNGAKDRIPVAMPWIGRRLKWARDEIPCLWASPSPQAALFFRHGGWIDRSYGECRIKVRPCTGPLKPNGYFEGRPHLCTPSGE